jgi:hypothetical protein
LIQVTSKYNRATYGIAEGTASSNQRLSSCGNIGATPTTGTTVAHTDGRLPTRGGGRSTEEVRRAEEASYQVSWLPAIYVLAMTGGDLCFLLATHRIPAYHAKWVSNLWPVIIVVFGAAVGPFRLRARQVTGLALGFSGAAVRGGWRYSARTRQLPLEGELLARRSSTLGDDDWRTGLTPARDSGQFRLTKESYKSLVAAAIWSRTSWRLSADITNSSDLLMLPATRNR